MLVKTAPEQEIACVPIERRTSAELPYEAFIREFAVPNRPVIIENAAAGWNALRTWTPEFFKTKFGSQVVDVTYGGVKMCMADLIDAVLASTPEKPGPYLHKVIIFQQMPKLLADLSPENPYTFPRRYCSPLMPRHFRRPDGYLKLLIGGVGGKFPLIHYDGDNAHALITEIYGDKEFVLFSPEDTPYIYPHPGSGNTSQIEDLANPDLDRYPLLAKATQYRGVIRPGETIFVPAKWWHSARVVTTSISVCTNMIDASNWSGFIDECCSPDMVKSAPVRAAKRAYLTAAGWAMNIAEQIQRTFPNGGLSNWASSVSPLSSLSGPRQRVMLERARG